MASPRPPLYVSRLELEHIKCFAEAKLAFDHGGDMPWTVIVGDNSAGKSVLLKSLALGLCDRTSAAGLLRESDEGYIRRDEPKGKIVVELCERDGSRQPDSYRIETTLTRIGDEPQRSFERLDQVTEPEEDFPWDRVFACAYGIGRAISGTGDIAGYSVINATYNLFSYGEGLQNPELNLLRLQDEVQVDRWLSRLAQLLPVSESGIHLPERGLTFDGDFGKNMPLRDLADGIRGTFLWTADLVGWAVAYDRQVTEPELISGIVLVDELEQHLHATWQREIVSQLCELFPRVQFVVTTHSPIIAASVGSLARPRSRDRLYYCELDSGSQQAQVESHESLQTYRFEQVLASRAFKYLIEAESQDLENTLRRGSELADKGSDRSEAEEAEYLRIKQQLASGEFLKWPSSVQREVEADKLRRLKGIAEDLERDMESDDQH